MAITKAVRLIKNARLWEFDKQDTEMLSEIVDNNLREMGINPESFSFAIDVDYIEEDRHIREVE